MEISNFAKSVKIESFLSHQKSKRFSNLRLSVEVNGIVFQLWRNGFSFQNVELMLQDFYQYVKEYFESDGIKMNNMLVFK